MKQEAGFQPDQRARLHRARGFALVELSRYDEAEEAYRTSLKHEPEHGLAQRELDYIAKLKAGAAPTPARTIGVEEARKAEPD